MLCIIVQKRDLEVTDIPIQNISYSKVGFSSHIFWRKENQRSWKTLKAHERTTGNSTCITLSLVGPKPKSPWWEAWSFTNLPCTLASCCGQVNMQPFSKPNCKPRKTPKFPNHYNLKIHIFMQHSILNLFYLIHSCSRSYILFWPCVYNTCHVLGFGFFSEINLSFKIMTIIII